jgi:hypothetical protein
MPLYKAFNISVGGTLLAIAENPYEIRASASKNITLKKTPIVRRIHKLIPQTGQSLIPKPGKLTISSSGTILNYQTRKINYSANGTVLNSQTRKISHCAIAIVFDSQTRKINYSANGTVLNFQTRKSTIVRSQ